MRNETKTADEWRAYFALFGPRLVLFARQWLPDVADPEDAVQEAFVRFRRKWQPPDESQAGLLFASVRHAALGHIRRETRRKHREMKASDQGFHPTQHEPAASWFESSAPENSMPIQTAMQRLAREKREVIVLKIWGELTFAQIGEVLELAPNTAAARYRYAVNALRKLLGPVCHERRS